MKISSKANSKYLSKADVPNPIRATMDYVRTETLQNPTEQKDVLHFTDDQLKPMVLNVTNKRVIIAAFGDETEDWRDREIEIYLDSTVPNSRGETVGGVRVRIPRAPASAPIRPGTGTGPRAVPAPPAAPAPKPATAPRISSTEAHNIILDGFANARTVAKLDEFAQWGKNGFDFGPDQDDVQSDAYHAALARIKTPGRRPAMA